eukprot:symbB.v1.2.017212.t1/scaffold1339.1/size137066/3
MRLKWIAWSRCLRVCPPRSFTTAAQVAEYASKKPTPVSIRSWLGEFAEAAQLAEFLQQEMPIRYAERIRNIEQLPQWQNFDELVAVHQTQLAAFQAFCEQRQNFDVKAFRTLVEKVQANDKKTKFLLMQAAQKMRSQQEVICFTDPFSVEVNKFLDDFLLSRLGCNMLLGQYLACTSNSHITSIVNPQCDAFEICQKAAEEVKRRCEVSQGRVPQVNVSAYTMTSGRAVAEAAPNQVPRFSYIPGILMHVVRELLKNSCQASLELANSEGELLEMPIDVVICADTRHVVIRITDLAGGIPRHVGSQIWSYLYSGSPTAMAGLSFGYGIGLPLSRLHAKYLGGSLDLVSLPGYGVDAYLSLPRVETDLVENIPDEDAEGGQVSQQINLLTL